MSAPAVPDLRRFDLGPFALASGHTLPEAFLAYRTIGMLNAAKDNVVLLPHMYSGTSEFMTAFVGAGRPLAPERWFFVLPAQFGSGESSSPGNTALPYQQGAFPAVAIGDDVRAGDLFFPPEDVRADAEKIPGSQYREIGSVWGHFMMFNLREADTAEIDAVYRDALT